MTLKNYLLLLTSILIVSCQETDFREFHSSVYRNKNLSIKKINEIKIQNSTKSDEKIGRLRFSFKSNENNSLFAFYDEIKKQFIITDNEGSIQHFISNKGRGPGETVKASGFNFDHNSRLVVYDEGQRRITVFSLDGNVLKSEEIESNNYSMSARDLYVTNNHFYTDIIEKRYLGNLKNAGGSALVGIYNFDGELQNTFGKYDPSVKDASSYLIFPILHVDFDRNELISAQSSGYRIQVYDLINKTRKAWFGAKTPNFKESDEYISPNLPRQEIKEKSLDVSFPVSVHSMSDYYIMYFENLTESFFQTNNFNEKKPFISIYDRTTFDCIDEIALPFVVGNISNDKLFLIENDNPDNYIIGVYEIVENN